MDCRVRRQGAGEAVIPSPYLIIGVLIALALAGWGGERVGERLNDQAWQKREAAINAQAATKIQEANDKVREAEHKRAADVNVVAEDYENQLKDKDDAHAKALAAARSGGLFVHTACPAPSGNAQGSVASTASVGNGQARARFSDADSEFLLAIGSEADRIVAQLTACQAVIAADRK